MPSKSKSKSQPKKSAFSDAKGATPPKATANHQPYKRDPARQRYLIAVFLVIAIGGGILAMTLKNQRLFGLGMGKVEQNVYFVKNEFKHDRTAFTQGLFLDGDMMYESTGLNGESTMRLVDYKTGDVKNRVVLDKEYFGEGCTMLNDKIYQLTWKAKKCFVYNRELIKQAEFEYDSEGWGLTNDGTHLIMSDGTAKLIYVDPSDFSVVKKVFVKFGNQRVSSLSQVCLNELEYYGGKIYANHYGTDFIYEIDAETGRILTRINLAGLWPQEERPTKPQPGILNGIAISPDGDIFVTGKYCPTMFEIEFIHEDDKKHREKQREKEKQRAQQSE